MVSALADNAHYQTSSLIWRNVRPRMMSFRLKIVYNKKKIQIFVMNMPFISSREARKYIFATHEICTFRFTRWNKWHIHSKNLNILYILSKKSMRARIFFWDKTKWHEALTCSRNSLLRNCSKKSSFDNHFSSDLNPRVVLIVCIMDNICMKLFWIWNGGSEGYGVYIYISSSFS